MNHKLSVIIPAYNEEDRIGATLNASLAYLGKQEYAAEIHVVSDGSTDQMRNVVQDFKSPPNVSLKFSEYYPNRGKGYAIKYGMNRVNAELVMFMDADYAVELEEVEKGIRLIEQGADIAIASRAIPGSVVTQRQNIARELSAKTYTMIQNLYLNLQNKDTQCGFKLFKRHAADVLFSRQRLDSVIFDPEILWLAKRNGFKVAEFPVSWRHVENSKIQYDSVGKLLFVFKELFKIRKLHRKDNRP